MKMKFQQILFTGEVNLRAERTRQSLEPEWNSDTLKILSLTGKWRHNVLSGNHWG